MKKYQKLMKWVGGMIVVSLMLAGCTLSGTGAVPLTPPEDMGSALLPTPTDSISPDVFATQTMQSQQAPVPTVTPTVDLTAQAAITPTADSTAEATGEAAEEPTDEATDEPDDNTVAGSCVYTVEAGDTLFNIAMSFDATVEDIASANGITDADTLDIGDELTIPDCSGSGSGSTGGTTGGSSGDTVYVVQPGDNLFRIALNYGIDWQDLAAYNGITDPTSLTIGQEIYIPSN